MNPNIQIIVNGAPVSSANPVPVVVVATP